MQINILKVNVKLMMELYFFVQDVMNMRQYLKNLKILKNMISFILSYLAQSYLISSSKIIIKNIKYCKPLNYSY